MAARRTELVTALALGAIALAGTALVARVDPHEPGHYPVCPLFALTGLYCAACGGLRAVHDLAHGDLAGAWDMNPVLVLAVPVLLVAWLRWVRRAARHEPPRPARGTAAPLAVLVLLVVYSVLRNVPALAPWLAP